MDEWTVVGARDAVEPDNPLAVKVGVTSGKHLRGEPCRDVKTFPVHVVDGNVEVMARPQP